MELFDGPASVFELQSVLIPLQHPGTALGVPRCTATSSPRRRSLRQRVGAGSRRRSEAEGQAVLDMLHEPRFSDQPPQRRCMPSGSTRGVICTRFAPSIGCWRSAPDPASAADAATQDPSPGAAPDGRCWCWACTTASWWPGGRAEEHVRLANRALERLMRAGSQAGAHHG